LKGKTDKCQGYESGYQEQFHFKVSRLECLGKLRQVADSLRLGVNACLAGL
jgi:hypothetical protein